MKRNIIAILAVLLCVAALTYVLDFVPRAPSSSAVVQDEAQAECTAAKMAPDFAFTDLNGKAHSLSNLRGKVVILNFWASWCAPCVKEFPHFLKAAQDYPDEIVFLAASSDFNRDAMARFTDKMTREHAEAMSQDNVLIFHDKNQAVTLDLFQTLRLPETILIDRHGAMISKIIGADWDYDDLRQDIENIVNSSDKPCE